jgi:hypothetical protein
MAAKLDLRRQARLAELAAHAAGCTCDEYLRAICIHPSDGIWEFRLRHRDRCPMLTDPAAATRFEHAHRLLLADRDN